MTEYSQVLYVLGIVFFEIRATNSIKKAQILADVMHNAPAMINTGSPEEEIIAKIMQNAKRQEADAYFSKLFEKAVVR